MHLPAGSEIQPATSLATDDLAVLFSRCYEGYFVPVAVDRAALERMIRASSLDLDASRVRFEDGRPTGLAMLGRRGARGWIGGMGMIPERRGRGGGRALMEAVLDQARSRRLDRVDLEVLEQNAPAIRIYRQLGFEMVRTLDVWSRPAGEPPADDLTHEAESLDPAECLARHAELHAEPAPWQRDLPSLTAIQSDLRAYGARAAGRIEACVMVRGDARGLVIEDVGMAPECGAHSIEAALCAALRSAPGAAANLVNLPAGHPAAVALEAAGFAVRLRQHEMTRVP